MSDVLTLPLPFSRHSETSRLAAHSMRARAGADRIRVYDFIAACDPDGATADECLVALCLSHQSGSARVSELARDGAIVDSLLRRPTRSGRSAVVWVPKPIGDLVAPERARRPSNAVVGAALAEIRRLLDGRQQTPELRAVTAWLISQVRR